MSDLQYYKDLQSESVRLAARAKILSSYSLEKQINISRLAIGYTQQDLDDMAAFIDGVRSVRDAYLTQIDQADLEALKSMNFSEASF